MNAIIIAAQERCRLSCVSFVNRQPQVPEGGNTLLFSSRDLMLEICLAPSLKEIIIYGMLAGVIRQQHLSDLQ